MSDDELKRRLAELGSTIVDGMSPAQVIELRRLIDEAARIGAEIGSESRTAAVRLLNRSAIDERLVAELCRCGSGTGDCPLKSHDYGDEE